MSENREDLEKKLSNCHENAFESSIKLEKAKMALRQLLDEYEWDYEPSAEKALYYGRAIPGQRKKDEYAKKSWSYIYDYKKIMWLINIAYDYCNSALDDINACQEV